MDFTGQERITAPRDVVWAALNDPDILKQCIPGCQALEFVGPNELVATIKVKLGIVSLTFTGEIRVSNIDAPLSYTLSAEGRGSIAGFAKGSADVTLRRTAGHHPALSGGSRGRRQDRPARFAADRFHLAEDRIPLLRRLQRCGQRKSPRNSQYRQLAVFDAYSKSIAMSWMIRSPEQADLEELANIYLAVRRETFTWVNPLTFRHEDFFAHTQGELVWLAEMADGEIAGFMTLWSPDDFIHMLYIRNACQGQGIGTALLPRCRIGRTRNTA
jgi:carbon monoxide dehydrogenase subunit G/GNAT superfamily N-acetyltransferase